MKKFIIFLFFLSFSFAKNQSFDISFIGVNFDYKEYYNNKILDSESSNIFQLKGLNLNYSTNDQNNNIIGMELRFLNGSTTYDGATWGGDPLHFKEYNVLLLNTQLFIDLFNTQQYIINSQSLENFYYTFGFGYRLWDRGKSHNDGDYNEIYYWKYYFLGFTLKNFNIHYITQFKFKFHQAINPRMKAYLGSGGLYHLGSTNGFELSIPIKYYTTPYSGFKIEYTYDYWHINQSDIVYITINDDTVPTMEPESKTNNQFISFGYFYDF